VPACGTASLAVAGSDAGSGIAGIGGAVIAGADAAGAALSAGAGDACGSDAACASAADRMASNVHEADAAASDREMKFMLCVPRAALRSRLVRKRRTSHLRFRTIVKVFNRKTEE
jgi:hypothetical protein